MRRLLFSTPLLNEAEQCLCWIQSVKIDGLIIRIGSRIMLEATTTRNADVHLIM